MHACRWVDAADEMTRQSPARALKVWANRSRLSNCLLAFALRLHWFQRVMFDRNQLFQCGIHGTQEHVPSLPRVQGAICTSSQEIWEIVHEQESFSSSFLQRVVYDHTTQQSSRFQVALRLGCNDSKQKVRRSAIRDYSAEADVVERWAWSCSFDLQRTNREVLGDVVADQFLGKCRKSSFRMPLSRRIQLK